MHARVRERGQAGDQVVILDLPRQEGRLRERRLRQLGAEQEGGGHDSGWACVSELFYSCKRKTYVARKLQYPDSGYTARQFATSTLE